MIVDLHHVAPDTVLVAWNAAAGAFALVTDAAPAAGMGDGEFVLGGRRIEAEDGVVRGPEGQLAGQRADDDRRRAQPARRSACRSRTRCGRRQRGARRGSAGRDDLGRLVPGAPADVVVLDDRLEIRQVLVDGRERVGGRS